MAPVEGDKKKQDAALADLNAGKAVKDVKADTTEIDIFAALQQGAMTDEQKAKLLAAGDEYFVLDSTDKGAAICKVIEKKAPKTVYNIGEVSFVVDPSKDTRANLLNDLQKFLDKNNTAQAFFDNAAKAEHSYTAMRDVVLSSQAMLGNSVKNSSKLIHLALQKTPRKVKCLPSSKTTTCSSLWLSLKFTTTVSVRCPTLRLRLTAR